MKTVKTIKTISGEKAIKQLTVFEETIYNSIVEILRSVTAPTKYIDIEKEDCEIRPLSDCDMVKITMVHLKYPNELFVRDNNGAISKISRGEISTADLITILFAVETAIIVK